VRATRTRHGQTTSNVLWSYGHETIPRHLRDIVISEYGIADLRGRTDEEIIAALLNITDSRFQEDLLARAKAAGKIRADYRIPEAHRANLPERLRGAFDRYRKEGHFSEYPFGTDLTAEEIALARALKFLDAHTSDTRELLRTARSALASGDAAAARHRSALERMQLEPPQGFSERFLRRLVAFALEATAASD